MKRQIHLARCPNKLENDLNVVVSSAVVDQINIGKEKATPTKVKPHSLGKHIFMC